MVSADRLAALLEAELACLRQLEAVLAGEHEALLAADAPAIERATAAKNGALGEQAQCGLQRQQYLQETGFEADSRGLDDCIGSCAEPTRLLELRDGLNALLQQCHEANRLNGRLIGHRQQQTRSALNVLRRSEQGPSTYTDAGDAVNSGSNRLLGKA